MMNEELRLERGVRIVATVPERMRESALDALDQQCLPRLVEPLSLTAIGAKKITLAEWPAAMNKAPVPLSKRPKFA